VSHFNVIQQKLEQFIKKYYTNELIKGAILFFSIGLLYFIITLFVEYFLWLEPTGRAILFWAFVSVETALFARFIAFPLAKLFRLQKGIGFEEASKIIGNHFPQVSDKLLNVIQLNQNQRESELLAASIDQKSQELQPVPFKNAIRFKKNIKYLKYAALPVTIITLVTLFWDAHLFSDSYDRVVNYDTAYEPPAPFQFVVQNDTLIAIENRNFTLRVRAEGDVMPENATVRFNNEIYYMEQVSPGSFEYVFTQPSENLNFRIASNKIVSRNYALEVVKTPSLIGFEMSLDYPGYTGKLDEVLKGSGSTTVPEGTLVTWKVNTKNTEEVQLKTVDSSYSFSANDAIFSFEKGLYQKLDYAITTSNHDLRDFENLSFRLDVVKDGFPDISVVSKQDTSDVQTYFFLGQVSDDYGLTKLQLVYYPIGSEGQKEAIQLPINSSNFDQFAYVFPGELRLEEGVSYEYYFEVFDNDAIHRYKSSKSGFYTYRKLTKEELENLQLDQQEKNVEDLSKRLSEIKEQDKRLEEITKTQKEKEELNWNDKKKLENFLQRQKQQEEMMKNFTKEMKENLEEFQPDKRTEDPFKEQLEKRLEENERMLEENEKLLEELERLQDKIDKEELSEKLEKLAKQNKNQEKNLEQLVELTKRYYVAKKAEKLMEELFKLGEEQERLSEQPNEENTKEAQEKLNEQFEEFQKEMDELQKENEGLKEPMDIPQDASGEKEVEKEQQEATDKLEQKNQQGAKENQKKAGEKMKKMSQQMQSQMQSGQMESIDEDVEMLRQILDNLVVFSFNQEDLMMNFNEIDYGSAAFGKKLNIQNDLKLNFQHIDDSLFALSLRQPLISSAINESLTNVNFNIDKSLERLAENDIRSGLGSQQYTVTGANELAVMLGELLGNMQSMAMSMSGSGQGKGKGQGQGAGFQLPDIIKKQKSLAGQMQEGMGQGKEGEQGEGENGKQGQGDSEGDGQSGEGKGKGGKGDGEGDDGGDGSKGGKDGKTGTEYNEQLNGELFEIYKQQQDLRNQLQNRLSKEGLGGQGGKIIKEMEGVEQMLLEKGFNNETLKRMLDLQYELLKLDEADFEQGKENRRESISNRRNYENTKRLDPEDLKKYFNQEEILNREALPLQLNYKKEVQRYFSKDND
jgi:chemotaxis protein histidine kinase CheA